MVEIHHGCQSTSKKEKEEGKKYESNLNHGAPDIIHSKRGYHRRIREWKREESKKKEY